MTSPVRVGLIGYGVSGRRFHTPLVLAEPRLRLHAVATTRTAEVLADHAGVVVTDAKGLIADPAVGLVVIATPNAFHAPLARAALAAGKHVVVDKPFVTDRAEGEALAALAIASGRTLAVFHNRRWDADFLTVRRLLNGEVLGRLAEATFAWDRFRPQIKLGWREEPGAGAGLLADLGPHLADQALALFGIPERITGDLARQRVGAQVDDWFAVTLHQGERRVVLAASTLNAAARPRFALNGTHASFTKHGIDPQEPVLRAGGTPDTPGYGAEPAAAWGRITDATGTRAVPSERGDWRRFYAGVAAAVIDSTPSPVTAADALNGLRLLDLARRSAASGRTLDWADADAR